MNDPRFDPESPEWNHQALADYNEDVINEHIAAEDERRDNMEEEYYKELLNDPRFGAAAEFWRDRMKGRIDKYNLDDVLAYYNLHH